MGAHSLSSASFLLPEICSERLLQDSMVPQMQGSAWMPWDPHVHLQWVPEHRVVVSGQGAGRDGLRRGGRLGGSLRRERGWG